MGRQVKKISRSFSLSDEEFADVLGRAKSHDFADRNEYLLALVEADKALHLAPVFDPTLRKIVLRPSLEGKPKASK